MLPAAHSVWTSAGILKGAAAVTPPILAARSREESGPARRAAPLPHGPSRTSPSRSAFPYSNHLWGTDLLVPAALGGKSLGKAKSRQGAEIHVGPDTCASFGPATTTQHSQVQLNVEGPNRQGVHFLAVGRNPPAPARSPRPGLNLEAFDYLAARPWPSSSMSSAAPPRPRSPRPAGPTARSPSASWTPCDLGAFLHSWEIPDAFMRVWLNIDAFDQAGVELGQALSPTAS